MSVIIDCNDKLEDMFNYLSTHQKIIFKSEKCENKVLTTIEKYNIAKDMFNKSPGLFLENFYKYLIYETHGLCFENLKSDEVVLFYLRKMKNSTNTVVMKNRRYKKLSNLLVEGNYFSREQMKFRQPLLYERYLGKIIFQDEEESNLDRNYDSFSGFLMNNMLFREDRMRRNDDLAKEKRFLAISSQRNIINYESEEEVSDDDDIQKFEDPKILEEEFLSIMKEKFLNGEDDYNYSEIDNDSTLDDLEELSRDLEEKYFDEEEEESGINPESPIKIESDEEFIEYSSRHKLNQYLNQ